jgi:hypothetical protein
MHAKFVGAKIIYKFSIIVLSQCLNADQKDVSKIQ